MSEISIIQSLQGASQALSQIPDPYFESECLLAAILGVDRLFLKKNPTLLVTAAAQRHMQEWVEARRRGIPLAYLTGRKAFWTLYLHVTPAVLIPRSDTERVVEVMLEKLPERLPYPVLELGTGSGAIALALATERPRWNMIATDRSQAALAVAKANAKELEIQNIQFYQGDWFTAIEGKGPFSAIVSNPPYIAASDPHLQDAALQAEPYEALCGGETGLEAYQHIIENAKKYLSNNGLLCLEHGHDQSVALFSLLQQHGYHTMQQFFDLGKQPRVMTAVCNVIENFLDRK